MRPRGHSGPQNVVARFGQFGLNDQTASYATSLGPNTSLVVAGQGYSDRRIDLDAQY